MVSAAVRTRVRVVTDSTATLPAGVADELGILVVPLRVVLGEKSGWEGVDILPADVSSALDGKVAVSTNPPTLQAFTSAFTAASALGREQTPYDVVSIHMSSLLSDTAKNAREGAEPLDFAGVNVEVVDSRVTAMALGFAVIAAARAAAQGNTAKLVARQAEEALRRTDAIFYVDTLEHLRRGGRIGPAAAFLGQAFSIKPLLQFSNGLVEPLEKVRGEGKALTRLAERIVERTGSGPVDIAIQHLSAPERAAGLEADLRRRLDGRLASLTTSEIGAVLGAHIGPGMVGAVVHRLAV